MPKNQVSRFQNMAEIKAAIATGIVTASLLTTSLPMVVATATPKRNGPTRFDRAVIARAARGDIARDAITVAPTLALSWNPLRKSKRRAVATKISKTALTI